MSQELNLDVAERIAMREKDSNALALIARIRELERAQPAGEAEPIAWGAFRVGGDRDGQLYAFCNSQHEVETYITQVHQASDNVTLRDAPLYAAPPAAANHAGIPEGWKPASESDSFFARAAMANQPEELTRLRRIAWLIGSIFVHGNFVAETYNERQLEKLLREQGTFWDTLSEFNAAAPHPTESHALGGDDE